MSEAGLTDAGRFLRERCAQPDAERQPGDPVRQSVNGYVPCAREHTPGRVCILQDGHDG